MWRWRSERSFEWIWMSCLFWSNDTSKKDLFMFKWSLHLFIMLNWHQNESLSNLQRRFYSESTLYSTHVRTIFNKIFTKIILILVIFLFFDKYDFDICSLLELKRHKNEKWIFFVIKNSDHIKPSHLPIVTLVVSHIWDHRVLKYQQSKLSRYIFLHESSWKLCLCA